MTSTFKSYGFSLFLHATLLCAMYAVPLSTSRRFSAPGQSQVIAIATEPSEPIALTINVGSPRPPAPTETPIHEMEDPTRQRPTTEIPEAKIPEIRNAEAMAESALREFPKRVQDQPLPKVHPSALTAMKFRRSKQTAPLVMADSTVRPPVRNTRNNRPMVLATTPVNPNVGFKKNESADLTNNPPPPYPREAIKNRIQGTVLLRLQIAKTGEVSSADVIRSSGHSVLDQAAVDAVATWTGKPARRWGQPIESTEVLPLRFRL